MRKLFLAVSICSLFLLNACISVPVNEKKASIDEHIVTIEVVSESGVSMGATQTEAWDFDKELPVEFGAGELKPSILTMIIPGKKAYFKLFSGLSVADTTRMEQTFIFLEERTSIRDAVILMNTGGGGAFDGLAMADMILEYQKKGFRITTKARGIIASAAVPIFAVGKPRIASGGCTFMVHEAALWKWPGRESASDIRAQGELMTLLRDRYIGMLVAHSKTPKAEWERMEGSTTWFNAEKAKQLGICDVIQ